MNSFIIDTVELTEMLQTPHKRESGHRTRSSLSPMKRLSYRCHSEFIEEDRPSIEDNIDLMDRTTDYFRKLRFFSHWDGATFRLKYERTQRSFSDCTSDMHATHLRRVKWKEHRFKDEWRELLSRMRDDSCAASISSVILTCVSNLFWLFVPGAFVLSLCSSAVFLPPLGHPESNDNNLIHGGVLIGITCCLQGSIAFMFDDEVPCWKLCTQAALLFIFGCFTIISARMLVCIYYPHFNYRGLLVDFVSVVFAVCFPTLPNWMLYHFGCSWEGVKQFLKLFGAFFAYLIGWALAIYSIDALLPASGYKNLAPISLTFSKIAMRFLGVFAVRRIPNISATSFFSCCMHFLLDGQCLAAIGVARCRTWKQFLLFLTSDTLMFLNSLNSLRKATRQLDLTREEWLSSKVARLVKQHMYFGSNIEPFKSKITEMIVFNILFDSNSQTCSTLMVSFMFLWLHPSMRVSVSQHELRLTIFPQEWFGLLCCSLFLLVTLAQDVVVSFYISKRGIDIKPIWNHMKASVRYHYTFYGLLCTGWLISITCLALAFEGRCPTGSTASGCDN